LEAGEAPTDQMPASAREFTGLLLGNGEREARARLSLEQYYYYYYFQEQFSQ